MNMTADPDQSRRNHRRFPKLRPGTFPPSAEPAPPRRGYQQPEETAGRHAGEVIYVAALAVTAGADVAAFYQVLSLTLAALGIALVWLAVAGFTVMSLTLAQFAGRLRRDRAAGYGTAGRWSAGLLLIPWGLLGLAALLARLIIAQADLNEPTTAVGADGAAAKALSGALLFFVLYLASGAVAGYGEYLTRNPLRAKYRAACRAHQRVQRRLARSQPPYERALSVWEQHERTLRAEAEDYQAAIDLREAQRGELKRYAAVLIAAHLQDPAATDGMTLPDRSPGAFPAPPSAPDSDGGSAL
jgi:hypothetical protein